MQNYSKSFRTLITEARLARNLTQKELADITGLTPALISKYESGKSKPRAETLQKIASALLIPSEQLIESANTVASKISIPYLSHSDLSYLVDQPYFEIDSSELIKFGIQSAGLGAMRYWGDSMFPTINSDDSILFDRTQRKILDGQIFLIEYGGLILIKRLYLMPFGALRLTSDNKTYPELHLSAEEMKTGELNIIGKVFWRSGAI